jgi:iron complex outermembrane recepter protein
MMMIHIGTASRTVAPVSSRPAVRPRVLALLALAGLLWPAGLLAQEQRTGAISGRVTLESTGEPLHNVGIVVVGTGKTTVTDRDGRYRLERVAPGRYRVLAQREHLSDAQREVHVAAGADTSLDFTLQITGVHEHVTVTASPRGVVTPFDTFNAVGVLDSFELARNLTAGTLGRALEDLPGVAERSYGPGTGRPIIRGFDGDRVLIMQDGIRTGDLSSQSGDHGVTIDPASLDRVEVVRGPATLLYGSNAVGGVVNAITPHEAFRTRPLQGLVGHVTTDVGSANAQAGGTGSVQYGQNGWLLWAGGGARRAGDYATPLGDVLNSATRLGHARGGVGYFGGRSFFSVGYQTEDGRYGVPFAGEFHGQDDHGQDDHDDDDHELLVDLATRRHSLRFDTGMRNMANPWLEGLRLTVNYLDWHHDEFEIEDGVEELGTTFDNRTWVLRADFDQRQVGRLSGRFGVWTQFRDYVAKGPEALAPPSTQQAFAAFAYEELDLGRTRVQFGARLEHNRFGVDPRDHQDDDDHDHDDDDDHLEPGPVRDRTFTGASASIGLRRALGTDSALVLNLTRSHRAPALEELYNFGPHAGNQLFEIGNTDLERESALSFDVSLRHQTPALRGELNAYYYDIRDFVFPALTGGEEGGLLVARFLQGDSRFTGFDARTEIRLHEHAWVNLGAGYVNAQVRDTGEALPRIPPLRATIGLEVPWRNLRIEPRLRLAASQDRVYGTETPTDGYAVVDVLASYLLPQRHVTHQFTLRTYNLTNELYRQHTSFIKDLAPEMGRGVLFTYAMRFF